MIDTLLFVAALSLTIASLGPLWRFDRWWVRIFDFPRLQLIVLSAVVLALLVVRSTGGSLWWISLLLAGVALATQVYFVLPYTRLWRKETRDAEGGNPTLTLVMANVLMTNRTADGLLDFIRQHKPDLIILDEPDDWWEQRLREIEADYPHTVKDPRSNTYGMLLYSRLPLVEQQQRCIVEEEIPSFHVCVRLEGRRVRLHFVHPKPPFPREARSTAGRDAELVVVGRWAAQEKDPVIVAGDLNDVAWSHTTRLFQRLSRLLDPRRGRGMYNTYHADYVFARWPLDHLFHSNHFRLVKMLRGPRFGSDHFPMLVSLEIDPEARLEQDPPDLRDEDLAEADRKTRLAASKPDPDA